MVERQRLSTTQQLQEAYHGTGTLATARRTEHMTARDRPPAGAVLWRSAWPGAGGGTWEPRLDMSETKDILTIKAEIPGLEAKHLDVSVSGDALTIKGEKKREQEEKNEQRHVVERTYGTFVRMVRLPAPVAQDKIKASGKNGVLTISLPKTEEAKQKAIPVDGVEG
jgi:HSP20 family protein